jgi:hypothetical protein
MNNGEKDTHSYKGWLNSDSFWKRALAVWGYQVVAQLIVGTAVLLAIFLIITVLGVSFS